MNLLHKTIKYLRLFKQYIEFYKRTFNTEYDLSTDNSKSSSSLKKIAFYIGCEDNRSERYRVHNFVKALRRLNISVDIYRSSCIKKLLDNINYDLVIIFREDRYNLLHLKKIITSIQKRSIPIIYDTDDFTIDDLSRGDARNIIKIIRLCDCVTVTTAYLSNLFQIATGKNVYVLRNTINDEQLNLADKLRKFNGKMGRIKIAYQSGTATHNLDFEEIEDSIIEVMSKYENVEFHIFGPLELSKKFTKFDDRIFRYSYVDYLSLEKLVSRMDINIAPLVLNDFNNSKSELKIFESALLEIPTVCSPIEPYKKIITNGKNGYVASTVDEWSKALTELIENKEKRIAMGKKAYEDFVPMFNVNNEILNVIRVYEEICNKAKNGYER